MKNFKITQEDAQKILDYLATCPYGIVAELVQILMTLKEEETKQEVNDLS